MDIELIRSETPGVNETAYLHNSGAALMPRPVVEAIKEYCDLEARVGGYCAADMQADDLEALYDHIATLIHSARDEIAVTENATVAWQMAFYSLKLSEGDRILTGNAEYAANYVAYLQTAKRFGVRIDVIPNTETGEIDVDELERMMDDRVKLISITWVPTNGGLVNPAEDIGKIAQRYRVAYLIDGCQAVGQMPVDVGKLQCDFLTGTGRKFLRGPRGTGFLYVRKEVIRELEPPMLDHFGAPWVNRDEYALRSDARRFETWENSYALRKGLSAAVAYAIDVGLNEIQNRAIMLADRLRQALHDVPKVRLRDVGSERCAIVSFTVEGMESDSVVAAARRAGIVVGASKPSSTRLDSEARGLPTLVRASPHYYNLDTEVGELVECVKRI